MVDPGELTATTRLLRTGYTSGAPTISFHDSALEPVRFCRREHPFHGWELRVLSSRKRADGQLLLQVELSDGCHKSILASWISPRPRRRALRACAPEWRICWIC